MTALSAARVTKSKNLGAKKRYPCAVDIIYAGGMVMIDSAGYANPALVQGTNVGVVGVATETVDNSGGSAGDEYVVVQEGWFLFAGTSLAQTSVGLPVYAEDDQTIDETQSGAEPIAGILMEVVSSTSGWVAIGPTIAPVLEASN